MIDKEMKKLFLTLALSCAIVFAAGAQPRALGFRYNGYSDAPFELSYQHWLFSNNVLEISVGDNYMDGGYVYNDGYEDNAPVYELGQGWLNSTFMFNWYFHCFGRFNWFAGYGFQLCNGLDANAGNFSGNIGLDTGFEYNTILLPLSLTFDYRPMFNVCGSGYKPESYYFGFGLRYRFW
jgi:hypothetical protein